eukprot:gene976-571_t
MDTPASPSPPPPAQMPFTGGMGNRGMGGGPLGGMENIQLLMQYLPLIQSFFSAIPGVLVGFSLTILLFLGLFGVEGFQAFIAPFAGFHLMALLCYREVHDVCRHALWQMRWRRLKIRSRKALHRDIAVQFREKLD